MIIALLVNFVVLSFICVGCDNVATPIMVRHKLTFTRTEVATALCFTIILAAYLARGVSGLAEISPLALIGPTYVHLTKTSTSPINLKTLLTEMWERAKLAGKWLSQLK